MTASVGWSEVVIIVIPLAVLAYLVVAWIRRRG